MLRPPSSSPSLTQDELGRRFGCARSVVTSAVTTRQKNKQAQQHFRSSRSCCAFWTGRDAVMDLAILARTVATVPGSSAAY